MLLILVMIVTKPLEKLDVGSSNDLGKSPVTQGDCSRRIHT